MQNGFEVGLVLTREDARVGRKQLLTPSPVAVVAESLGLNILKSNKLSEQDLATISSSGCALGLVVAYGNLLKPVFLEALPLGWINLHYSLLPALRGAAPVQHALSKGLTETGVSVFHLDQGMDTGPIYLQVPTKIEMHENAEDLLNRLTQLGITALREVLPGIFAGTARAIEQSEKGASFAPKISRLDAKVDWKHSAIQIANQVRALYPEPVAWTLLGEQVLRIIDCDISAIASELHKAEGSVFLSGMEVGVTCGDETAVILRRVQPAGKQPMSASDWFRGFHSKGVVLG